MRKTVQATLLLKLSIYALIELSEHIDIKKLYSFLALRLVCHSLTFGLDA